MYLWNKKTVRNERVDNATAHIPIIISSAEKTAEMSLVLLGGKDNDVFKMAKLFAFNSRDLEAVSWRHHTGWNCH